MFQIPCTDEAEEARLKMSVVKSLGWSCSLTAAALERVDFELMEWWSTCGCVSVLSRTVIPWSSGPTYLRVSVLFQSHVSLGLPASTPLDC